MEKEKLNYVVDELLNFLSREMEIKISTKNKLKQVYDLLAVYTPQTINKYFIMLQDLFLSGQNKAKKVGAKQFKNNVACVENKLSETQCDLLVYFSPNTMLQLGDAESELMLKAGVQLKVEYFKTLKQTGFLPQVEQPYIFKAYNLPSKYIAKIYSSPNEQGVLKQLFIYCTRHHLKTAAINLNNSSLNQSQVVEIKPQNLQIVFCAN